MENIIGILIIGGLFVITYKFLVVNAKFPTDKVKDYLIKNNLDYIRHRKIKKHWNPNFERSESILTLFSYRKHYFEVDVLDSDGNPVEINGRWYQSMSFFHKNKLVFESE